MYNLKLICKKDLLLQYINIVNKAVSNRTTLPILECILLTADERGFVLTGNDLELGIKTASIDAEIIEKGEIAIEARIFNEIIRRLNGEDVILSSDDKNAVTIICGSSEFTIMGQGGEDFPALPEVEQNQAYTLKQNELRNMIRQTIFSIAQDNSKPVLTGELFEFSQDFLNIVSVDGYRISYRKNNLLNSYGKNEVIVPGKTLSELNKILSQEEEDLVSVYVTDKHILFDLGTAIMVSRLIAGDFIRYEQSFSEDFKTEILIDKSELIQSLERASLVSRDNRKTPVRFKIKTKSLEITAKSDMGTAFEEISAEIEGEEISIAFNPRYFIEALRSIDEDRVKIHFTASLSPCTILPVEGDSFKYLILPLRI
ncbi:DNA polymerase III subunit beta [Anaerotignum sp.]|uniref:DNA polymerase III subunit beta n=1 Tax=Anaerotignum sp. TaxID=2039241 RepID=UPI00331D4163